MSLSQNVQTLSATSAQQIQFISRLEARNAELDRQLALSSAQEQAAKKTLKNAESRLRALKEEMAKLKGTVGQIRQQCANDIRRRDQELARLKRHLEGRRGREGNGSQGGIIVITPGLTKPQPGSRNIGNEVDVTSSQYSLRQETTEFLTQLSQGLSDENDALIGLVRRTLSTLRTLQGLPAESSSELHCCGDTGRAELANVVMTAPPTYEDLAANIEKVLNNLQGILTNPSFVPLAEVEVREDEIIKLREGWEKMEARWREAVTLMDGWKQRMEHTGDTINLDDLKIGIELGTGLPEAPSPRHFQQLPRADESAMDGSISLEVPREASPKPSYKDDDGAAQNLITLIEPQESKVLQAKSGNSRPSFLPRKVSFSVIPEENTKDIRDFEDELILDLCAPSDSDALARTASPDPKEVIAHQIWTDIKYALIMCRLRLQSHLPEPYSRSWRRRARRQMKLEDGRRRRASGEAA